MSTAFLTEFMHHTVTHWVLTGKDGFGDMTFAAPVQMAARWEERSEYVINAEGVRVLTRSRVFLSQDVTVGDFLFLGTSAEANPRIVPGAYAVLDFRRVPSILGDDVEEKRALL